MTAPARLPIVALVSALTFAFGAAPATAVAAAPEDYSSLAAASAAAEQTLNAELSDGSDTALDALTDLSDRGNTPHGFDVDAAAGFGLTALRERVDRLAGSVEIESAPGAGTALSIAIPVGGVAG